MLANNGGRAEHTMNYQRAARTKVQLMHAPRPQFSRNKRLSSVVLYEEIKRRARVPVLLLKSVFNYYYDGILKETWREERYTGLDFIINAVGEKLRSYLLEA